MRKSYPDAAEHGIAADRFAREIVRILAVGSSALAATECQTVGRLLSMLYQRHLSVIFAILLLG
jgi:hypothetical protein